MQRIFLRSSTKFHCVRIFSSLKDPKRSNQDLWSISNYLGITAGQPTHGFVGITQIRRKQQYCKYSSSVNHDRTRVNGGWTLTRLETAYFDVRSLGATTFSAGPSPRRDSKASSRVWKTLGKIARYLCNESTMKIYYTRAFLIILQREPRQSVNMNASH